MPGGGRPVCGLPLADFVGRVNFSDEAVGFFLALRVAWRIQYGVR